MEPETFNVLVPDNAQAFAEYQKRDLSHVKTFSFTEEEINSLLPLFDQLNDAFGKIIDLYETEYLKPENLAETLKLTRQFKEENSLSNFTDAILRFQVAVELAIANNVWLLFEF